MTRAAAHVRPFAGRLWRICAEGADPLALVGSPMGRFHHDGQPALYASSSPEGAGVALASYLTPNDPARWIWPLQLAVPALADLRDPKACAALGVDPRDLVSRWAEARAEGRAVRSWQLSDRMRAKGLDGFLYPSRKSPEHGHVALFGTTGLRKAGPPRRWVPPVPDC
ncbi:RES family NAD+ phosphorylase [Limimaricola cinnabarinus]|uniref:RES family NAD+ phosphorylase n=1 Tax=Limimaricola cinnabarinus TaxID=1125964 RepID=UPI002FE089C4